MNTVYGRFESRTLTFFSSAAVTAVFTVLLASFEAMSFYSNNHMISWLYSIMSMAFVLSIAYLHIIFLVWVYTLTDTARLFDIETGTTPRMAVIWFFVPVVNFFKPYINMRNMWLSLNNCGSAGYKRHWIIKIWWFISVCFYPFLLLVLQAEWSVDSIESLRYAEHLYLVLIPLNFLYVIAIVLLVADFRHKFSFQYNKLNGGDIL